MRKRYVQTIVLAVLILLAFQVSDAGAESTLLKEGMSGQGVLELQTKLQRLGYLGSGVLDGIFGPATLSAVISFQGANGIEGDGIAGPATLSAINGLLAENTVTTDASSNPNVLKKGMTGDNVLNLQTKLKSLGYYQNNLDGNFGSGTLLALIDFQLTNGLAADGVAGPETMQALQNSPATASRGASGSRKSEMMASYAKQFLGTPYVWGGSSPDGFDCSGFTSYICKYFGIYIPRMADEQYYYGAKVSQLVPGDLVFFTTYTSGPSHAGIYIGDNCFIHSSSAGGGVIISSLSDSYYSARYLGARRVVN